MSANGTFTHKAFCSRKVNAVHSVPDCVRGVLIIHYVWQISVAMFSKKGLRILSEKVVPFRENPRPFSCDLQSSPFLYVLTVFLQMEAYDVLHEAGQVAAPVAQPADDEVRTFLCRPAQINRLSVVQFGRNKERLFVGFKSSPSHLGTDAPLNGCILCVQCRFGWLGSYYFSAICFL